IQWRAGWHGIVTAAINDRTRQGDGGESHSDLSGRARDVALASLVSSSLSLDESDNRLDEHGAGVLEECRVIAAHQNDPLLVSGAQAEEEPLKHVMRLRVELPL